MGIIKTQNLILSSNPLKKVQKYSPKKVYSLACSNKSQKLHFFCHFFVYKFFARLFCNFFNGFEISIKR
jgi:hypothetical protein